MYGTLYTRNSKTMSNVTDAYYYGNDVTYLNGTYTLTNTITSSDWSNIYNGGLNNNHYTCFSTGTTCTYVHYIYYTDSNGTYYITLTEGKKVEDALAEMLNYNTTSSVIKGSNTITDTLDYWYYTNIEQKGYSNYVEDTVWCNDRSIYQKNGWESSGGSTTGYLLFEGNERAYTMYNPSLICSREADKFTVNNSNGNGALDYPVGLLTVDEIMLAGGKYGSANNSYYLYNGSSWWSGSPCDLYNSQTYMFYMYSDGSMYSNIVHNVYGIRPSISLISGVNISSGIGTITNPYIVTTD